MISLQVENYCRNCPEFEPHCSRLAKLGEYATFIECEHEVRCRLMKKYIEQQISGKVENYCQNCPEFEPRCYDTFIECEHKVRCRMMKKYIEQQISGKEEQRRIL